MHKHSYASKNLDRIINDLTPKTVLCHCTSPPIPLHIKKISNRPVLACNPNTAVKHRSNCPFGSPISSAINTYPFCFDQTNSNNFSLKDDFLSPANLIAYLIVSSGLNIFKPTYKPKNLFLVKKILKESLTALASCISTPVHFIDSDTAHSSEDLESSFVFQINKSRSKIYIAPEYKLTLPELTFNSSSDEALDEAAYYLHCAFISTNTSNLNSASLSLSHTFVPFIVPEKYHELSKLSKLIVTPPLDRNFPGYTDVTIDNGIFSRHWHFHSSYSHLNKVFIHGVQHHFG
ncbi:hypothetical protein A3715_18090 [Oleiphilus sp. HI0009]|nr:hypothetical protein A3715_18090 [Oleiphilus sp. HI0009]